MLDCQLDFLIYFFSYWLYIPDSNSPFSCVEMQKLFLLTPVFTLLDVIKLSENDDDVVLYTAMIGFEWWVVRKTWNIHIKHIRIRKNWQWNQIFYFYKMSHIKLTVVYVGRNQHRIGLAAVSECVRMRIYTVAPTLPMCANSYCYYIIQPHDW